MKKFELIVTEAAIRVRTTKEGGRRGPVYSGYRPSFYFRNDGGPDPDRATWRYPFGERQSDGEIRIIGSELLHLGEEGMAIVRYSNLAALVNWLSPGCVFVFCEGAIVVGTGSIIRILQWPD